MPSLDDEFDALHKEQSGNLDAEFDALLRSVWPAMIKMKRRDAKYRAARTAASGASRATASHAASVTASAGSGSGVGVGVGVERARPLALARLVLDDPRGVGQDGIPERVQGIHQDDPASRDSAEPASWKNITRSRPAPVTATPVVFSTHASTRSSSKSCGRANASRSCASAIAARCARSPPCVLNCIRCWCDGRSCP